MAELAASSTNSGDDDVAEEDEVLPPDEAPKSVVLDQLLGSWESNNGDDGTVSLTLSESGEFTWKFEGKDKDPFEMKGAFNLGQASVLTLDADESQMAGTGAIDEEGNLNFVLAGGPPGDPGLLFEKG